MMKVLGKALMAGVLALGLGAMSASAQEQPRQEGQQVPQAPRICEPQLNLYQEPDGQLTLTATTYMPNGCFVAQEAEQKTPEGIAVTPETLPVILRVEKQGTICAQYLKPVRHYLGDLEDQGRRRLTVFVVRDGQVCGQTSVDLQQVEQEQPPIETSEWRAWAGPTSRQLSEERRLYVEGTVTLPNPCYRASLQPVEPNNPDPGILALRLEVQEPPPEEFCPQVLVERTVFFQKPYTGNEQVNIRIEGGELREVPVRFYEE